MNITDDELTAVAKEANVSKFILRGFFETVDASPTLRSVIARNETKPAPKTVCGMCLLPLAQCRCAERFAQTHMVADPE